MPSIFNAPVGSGGAESLSSRISLDMSSSASSAGARFAPSAGRASVNIAKPETIGQSLEGLGKGFLGLVGSVPLVGGLAKGALEMTGGAIGAVGSAIGSFKPVQQGPSVGDVVGSAGGAALSVISAPQRFVVNETFNKSIARGLIEHNSSVKEYYDIPAIKQMVDSGASIDELAAAIQERGMSFGTKPDIVRDLAMGLITDPLTYVPFGAIVGKAKYAGGLAKAVETGAALAETDAKFLSRWQPLGQAYNAVAGTLSGTSGAIARAIAGRTHNMLEMAFKVSNLKSATAKITEIVGAEAPQILSKLSEYTATTIGRTTKAGVASLIEEEAALAVKNSAHDLIMALSDTVDPLKGAFAKATTNAEKEALLKQAFLDNAELLGKSGFKKREIMDMLTGVLSSKTDNELADVINSTQALLQREALGIRSAKEAEQYIATEGRLRGNKAVAAGARLLIAGKQELIRLAENPAAARQYVINAFTYVGLNAEQAARYFDELVLPAINAKDFGKVVDFLEFTRMPAYGKLAEGIANVRQSMQGIGSRLTLISSRSLSQERAQLIIRSLTTAADDAVTVRNIIKQAINQYDDLYEVFKNVPDTVTAKEVIKQLKNRMSSFVRDITQDEVGQLSKEALTYGKDAERLGYRLGIAPEDGVIEKWTTLTDKYGRAYHTKSFAPYADLVDTAFTNPQRLGSDLLTYKRNVIQSMVRHAFSPRYGTLIAQKAANQFVFETSKLGIAQSASRDVWNAIHDLADKQQILPRGLSIDLVKGEGSLLAKTINESLGKETLQLIAERSGVQQNQAWAEVFKGLMRAYAGDLSDIGIMPAVTSMVKMKVPAVAAFTDNFFPQLRFGWAAPQFRYVQENIEPVFFRFTSGAGVREARIAGLNANDIRVRAILGEFSVIREIGDAQTVFMVAGNYAAGNIAKKAPRFVDALGALARGEGTLGELGLSVKNGILAVDDRKRRAMQAIISRGAALRAYGVMSAESPELMTKLVKFFGTKDPEQIMHIIGLDFIARTDPVAFQKLVDAGVEIGVRQFKTEAERAAYRDIVSAFRKAAADEGERARRAIYFDPNRPWWERSLNHPLLALYPLSYMVGKIIPEFTRVLVATPFAKNLGGTRPFLGAEALRLLSESTVAASQYDPEFTNAIQDNPEFWTFINFLLPYTPDNIGFGFSSTLRKLAIEPGLKGQMVQVGRIPQEAWNQLGSSSIPGTWRMANNAVTDVIGTMPEQQTGDTFNLLDIFQNNKN